MTRAQLRAQFAAADLADRGGIETVDEHNLVRHLERGQAARAHPGFQCWRLDRLTLLDHERAAALTEIVVGNGDHGGVEHARVSQQMIFDLFGGDFLTGPVDVVTRAPLHHQVAARKLLHAVTGAVEAVVAGDRLLLRPPAGRGRRPRALRRPH
ncbi:hypothetical protein G6F31_016877 [Rhizopus arrhizus]|nr:hypothetical protein G6F31_016877 [Rhizopus arrhizus]